MTTRHTDLRDSSEVAPTSGDDESASASSTDSTSSAEVSSPTRSYNYIADRMSTPSAALQIVLAMLGGGLFALLTWLVLRNVSLAAFNESMVTRALSTACSLITVVVVAVLLVFWLRDFKYPEKKRPRWRELVTRAACALAPAALVMSSIGIPLSSTRLYLDGIQVDQGFRTQFLTRMADTMANQDMNYADLPSYYPVGWFWLGGRLANLLNLPGWEVYQPWALVSLSMAASALVPVWHKLGGSLALATALALVNTATVLTLVPEEPYAAIVALGVVPAVLMGYGAMKGLWSPTIGVMIYLGISASFYTLYTAIIAVTMVIFAITTFLTTGRGWRTWEPFRHLLVIGVGSMLIALVTWWPYLWARLSGDYAAESQAQHFLPSEGTTVPLPFFELSFIGLLSLAGLIYMIVRFREPELTYMGLAVAVCYVWIVASMVTTLTGTTLLGFRVEVLIALLLSSAGVVSIGDLRLIGVDNLYPEGLSPEISRSITTVFLAVFGLATVAYVQQIPSENETFIDEAYASTDGYGERGDQRESDVGRYYVEMNEFIESKGYAPDETVVLTDEINFMSYYPYYGFNAFTAHYANPLGEFEARNEQIADWARGSFEELSSPDEMLTSLDDARWRSPDVFIFRGKDKQQVSAATREQNATTSADTPAGESSGEPGAITADGAVSEAEIEAEAGAADAPAGDSAGEDESTPEPWKTHIAHDIYPSQPNVRYEALFFNPEAFASPAWSVEQFGPFVVVVRN